MEERSVVHGHTPGMVIPEKYRPISEITSAQERYDVMILNEARVQVDKQYPDATFVFTGYAPPTEKRGGNLYFQVRYKSVPIGSVTYRREANNKPQMDIVDTDGATVASLDALFAAVTAN